MARIYRIYAGKIKGKGSRDKRGFSSNGQFFHFMSESKSGAIAQFRRKNKGYRLYEVSSSPMLRYARSKSAIMGDRPIRV